VWIAPAPLYPPQPPPGTADDPYASPPQARRAEDVEDAEDVDDRHSRRSRSRPRDWEDEDDRPPRRRFRCPFCGSSTRPYPQKHFGTTSILLVCIGIIFWPLIIVAFFVQEEWLACGDCGERIRPM
jgi:hypothetical protein